MADGIKAHPPYAVGIDPSHAGDAVGYMLNRGVNEQRAQVALETFRQKYPSIFLASDEIMAQEQSKSRLDRVGPAIETHYVQAGDVQDAIASQAAKNRAALQQQWISQAAQQPKEKVLADFSNASLVMEMISRGYAVMKLPADGGPPEVLR